MIKPHPSGLCQQQSTCQSHNVSRMNSKTNPTQVEPLTTNTNPHRVLANVGSHGYEFCGLLKGDHTIKSQGLSGQQSTAHLQNPILIPNMYAKEQQLLSPARVDGRPLPFGAHSLQRKKFLIFDQSGEETRLIFSSLGSSPVRNLMDLETKPILGHKKYFEEHLDIKSMRACPDTQILCEESDENHIVDGEGSDYHEDTEEINALLYSEDDEDGEGEDANCDMEDEDEVSTGHSPLAVKMGFENAGLGDDIDDEVTSLDHSSKRQKLLDGGCSKSSFINTERVEMLPARCYEGESVVDLHASPGDEKVPISGNERLRKDKIRDTLKVLKKLIPGPTSEDPSVIIDQAINYLKYLKLKAKSQSLEDPEKSGY